MSLLDDQKTDKVFEALREHVLTVPVPVTITQESRLVLVTKFLSWLCAVLLATSVLVALTSVTNERNNLQTQIEAQSMELECRSKANGKVNEANAQLNTTTAEQNRIIGEIVLTKDVVELEALNIVLDQANDHIIAAAEFAAIAVQEQKNSITICSRRD